MPRPLALLATLLALLLPASVAAGAAPSLTWELAPTAGEPAERVDERPPAWDLILRIRDPDRFLCLGGDYLVTLDGRPVAARWRGFCEYTLTLSRLGTRTLRVTALASGKPPRPSAVARMELRELTVVIAGDSVASGDGTPARRFIAVPRWRDRACRRSDAAGVARAVADLEHADPATVIRLINVACSGASLDRGILAPQGDVAPAAQLPAAARALGGRAPSAVIVIAGANDAGFNHLIRTCLIEVGDCRSRPTEPGRLPLAADLAERISDLPDRFAAVASCLAGRECPAGPSPTLPAERVVVGPYFDPTRGEDGRSCRFPRRTGARAITPAEMAWARSAVLAPLNTAVRRAAARHGWRLAAGIPTAFAGHGICSSDPWVLPPRESLLRQGDLRGTFHPNTDGHACYARSVGAALGPALIADGLSAPTPSPCTS